MAVVGTVRDLPAAGEDHNDVGAVRGDLRPPDGRPLGLRRRPLALNRHGGIHTLFLVLGTARDPTAQDSVVERLDAEVMGVLVETDIEGQGGGVTDHQGPDRRSGGQSGGLPRCRRGSFCRYRGGKRRHDESDDGGQHGRRRDGPRPPAAKRCPCRIGRSTT